MENDADDWMNAASPDALRKDRLRNHDYIRCFGSQVMQRSEIVSKVMVAVSRLTRAGTDTPDTENGTVDRIDWRTFRDPNQLRIRIDDEELAHRVVEFASLIRIEPGTEMLARLMRPSAPRWPDGVDEPLEPPYETGMPWTGLGIMAGARILKLALDGATDSLTDEIRRLRAALPPPAPRLDAPPIVSDSEFGIVFYFRHWGCWLHFWALHFLQKADREAKEQNQEIFVLEQRGELVITPLGKASAAGPEVERVKQVARTLRAVNSSADTNNNPASVHSQSSAATLTADSVNGLNDTTAQFGDKVNDAAQPNSDSKESPQLVRLDQIAAIVNRNKRTLEGLKKSLPPPILRGGGGKPAEWIWSEVRPWLEGHFGRQLPATFPELRRKMS
jgi:hypothetical protein